MSRPSTRWAQLPRRVRDGGRLNAVLAAAGYYFGLLLRWLEVLLRALFASLALTAQSAAPQQRTSFMS
jgi:hypothetical protein